MLKAGAGCTFVPCLIDDRRDARVVFGNVLARALGRRLALYLGNKYVWVLWKMRSARLFVMIDGHKDLVVDHTGGLEWIQKHHRLFFCSSFLVKMPIIPHDEKFAHYAQQQEVPLRKKCLFGAHATQIDFHF